MKQSILILLLLISINIQTNGCNLEKDENKNIISFVNNTVSDDIIIGNLSYIEKKIWTLANNDSSVCDCNNDLAKSVFLFRIKILQEPYTNSNILYPNKKLESMAYNFAVLTKYYHFGEQNTSELITRFYNHNVFTVPIESIKKYEEWFDKNKNSICIDKVTSLIYVPKKIY